MSEGARADAVHHGLDDLREVLTGLGHRLDAVERDLRRELHAWERRNRRDILTAADWDATATTADFWRQELSESTAYFAKEHTLRAALERAPREGLYLEFGVASGGTLRVIAEAAPVGAAFGFDSFEGLPEHWRNGFTAGAFAQDGLPEVPGAELVVGWFDQTLPGFLEAHPEPVAFLHLDADLYSSTRTVLEALAPRLREGTVVVFDEYFNFPGWQDHEHRAWTEFVQRTGLTFEYLGFTADDEQLSLRLTSAPDLTDLRPDAAHAARASAVTG
ncbi:class I SAM-dependent methyltransferase [Geodermatophilus sp. SYSU D01180]